MLTPVRFPIRAVAASLALLCLAGCTARAAADPANAPTAPEFAHLEASDWINSAPLSMKGLRGQVVVLDVWTFG